MAVDGAHNKQMWPADLGQHGLADTDGVSLMCLQGPTSPVENLKGNRCRGS